MESYLSRLNYNFRDKYYLSLSARTDGSSRFAPDYRWGKFWSVGASWRVSQEGFMDGINWLDDLKLKASYGSQGNDNLGTYYAYLQSECSMLPDHSRKEKGKNNHGGTEKGV